MVFNHVSWILFTVQKVVRQDHDISWYIFHWWSLLFNVVLHKVLISDDKRLLTTIFGQILNATTNHLRIEDKQFLARSTKANGFIASWCKCTVVYWIHMYHWKVPIEFYMYVHIYIYMYNIIYIYIYMYVCVCVSRLDSQFKPALYNWNLTGRLWFSENMLAITGHQSYKIKKCKCQWTIYGSTATAQT